MESETFEELENMKITELQGNTLKTMEGQLMNPVIEVIL